MNYEKIGYSLIASLIAGSIIQKNMGLEHQYFFFISVGLWVVCIGVQWWNCKIEQKKRDKSENLNLESRDAIVKKIQETISEGNEKEIECLKQEIGELKKIQKDMCSELTENFNKAHSLIKNTNDSIDVLNNSGISKLDELIVCYKSISSDLQVVIGQLDKKIVEITHINKKVLENVETVPKTEELLNSIIELGNNSLENMKSIEEVSVDNKDCICGKISAMKELVDCNHKDAVARFEEVTSKTTKDICSQLIEQSCHMQELIKQKIDFISHLNEKYVSTIGTLSSNIIDQIQRLKDELEANKNTLNGAIENEQKSILESLSELMNLLNTINTDTKGKMSEVYTGLCGILSNLQSVLDATESKIGDIQNTDNSMYGLLEDAKNKLNDVEGAIGEGVGKIEDAVSQSMERQNEIVTEEQCILNSYNELLGRINDEVIAKLISDSNSLLKCMRDCYNLLDSQRRAKR